MMDELKIAILEKFSDVFTRPIEKILCIADDHLAQFTQVSRFPSHRAVIDYWGRIVQAFRGCATWHTSRWLNPVAAKTAGIFPTENDNADEERGERKQRKPHRWAKALLAAMGHHDGRADRKGED